MPGVSEKVNRFSIEMSRDMTNFDLHLLRGLFLSDWDKNFKPPDRAKPKNILSRPPT